MGMTTQVVFNIDSKIKAKAMKRAKSEGVPFAMIMKMSARAYAEGRLHVDIGETPNAKTARELRADIRDFRAGKTRKFSPGFTRAEGAIRWLERNDK
jgi:antitoxin component of RelBE/YafQ-DinJ toxin-antitoxin module